MDSLPEALASLKRRTQEYNEASAQYKAAHAALIAAQSALFDAREHVDHLRAVAFAQEEVARQLK